MKKGLYVSQFILSGLTIIAFLAAIIQTINIQDPIAKQINELPGNGRKERFDPDLFRLNSVEKIISYCKQKNIEFNKVSYSQGSDILRNKFHYLLASDIYDDHNIIMKLSANFEEMIQQLDGITKIYFRNFQFDRSECDIKFSDLKKFTRRKGTLIEFPDFQKHHIVSIANSGYRLPAGISRHRIVNRVLHVKYEIKKLYSDRNILHKQNELKQLLTDKIDKNKVRQYQESVIVFDE